MTSVSAQLRNWGRPDRMRVYVYMYVYVPTSYGEGKKASPPIARLDRISFETRTACRVGYRKLAFFFLPILPSFFAVSSTHPGKKRSGGKVQGGRREKAREERKSQAPLRRLTARKSRTRERKKFPRHYTSTQCARVTCNTDAHKHTDIKSSHSEEVHLALYRFTELPRCFLAEKPSWFRTRDERLLNLFLHTSSSFSSSPFSLHRS